MGPANLAVIETVLQVNESFDYGEKTFEELLSEGMIEYIGGREYYIFTLEQKIDTEAIKSSGVKIIYDAMFGSGQGMMDGLINITALSSEVNSSFCGSRLETVAKNLYYNLF